jgi:DNA-binding protein HU-beta
MNKGQLIDEVARHTDLAKPDATRVVEALFGPEGIIARELRSGEKVQVTGFGTFLARRRAARQGRDPRTGDPVAIAAAVVPAFKPGQQLRDALNTGG